jgi:2-methylcitrate dehydratase PrpD
MTGPNVGLTEYLTEWGRALRFSDIPSDVLAEAIRHVVDGYGVGLSGHGEEGHRILRDYVAEVGGAEQVQVFGTPLRASAELAALVNGQAMHAMDFDDTQLSTNPESVYGLLTHPTTPVLGAASAAAELVDADGKDLLTAYVAGVEVACRVADAMFSRHYQEGFHTTGTVGAFGAVTAAGKLLGLSAEEMRYAFGIAAPLGGGYRENFGTMTKPLHAGQAAQAGVFAARLAKAGFTSAVSIVEAPRGFYNAAAGGYEPSRIDGKLGDPFFLVDPGVSIKPYPSGSLSHPGQDAVLALVEEYDVQPEDVEEAVAGTNSAMPNALIYAMPQTALEAKFSFPFFLAIAILRRRVGIAEFTDEVVRSPEVQEMMKRCHHVVDPEIDARGFQHLDTKVQIKLKDGTVLERTERAATGHPDKPISRAQIDTKFLECAELAIDEERARDLLGKLWDLPSVESVAELHRLLAVTAAEEVVGV